MSLTRIVGVAFEGGVYAAAFLTAGGLTLLVAGLQPWRWNGGWRRATLVAVALTALGFAGSLLVGRPWLLPRFPQLVAVELGVWGSLAVAGLAGWKTWRGSPSLETVQWFHVGLMAFAISYGLSLSWGAFELMACPSFAVAVCAATTLIPGAALLRPRPAMIASALVAVCAFLVRTHFPFDWIFWREPPVSEDVYTSKLPALAGMRMGLESTTFYERITDEIDGASQPGDRLFVYPHMPIFHVLAERLPATYSPIDFFDVAPDAIASADAERLLASPPKVIVILDMPGGTVADLEQQFRAGKRAGQRDILAAIDKLVPVFRVVDKLGMPGSHAPVFVLVRKDPPIL